MEIQIADLECLVETVITLDESRAATAWLVRSISAIGPLSAVMPIAEMPKRG